MSIANIDWPYFTFEPDGRLRTDVGDYLVGLDGKTPTIFASALDAEQYLIDFDVRGSVR